MDKGDSWLPRKVAPMSGKIPGAEAGAFNHTGPINTCQGIDYCSHQEGSSIMVWASWQEGLLIV